MSRVVVAMSGGVDSSVVAALLVEQGHEVIGMTMHLSDAPVTDRTGTCCAPDDAHDARRVANHLGIPHYVANYKKAFKTAVIDRFVADYQNGLTPSPCVRCNDVLKFKLLLSRARELDAEYLATGHYARILAGASGPELHRAVDHAKDQSYFLFGASQDALSQVMFPIGAMDKPAVRDVARRFELPVAEKAESMDICFVPDGDYARFVEENAPPKPGRILDESGEVLGDHGGIHRFTIGQRRGLGLPGGTGAPRFVIGVSGATGDVTVGGAARLLASGLDADRCNWIGAPPAPGTRVLARIRHRSAPDAAVVEAAGETLRLRFEAPIRAVAPGQAAVLYDAEQPSRVWGGGWIRASLPVVEALAGATAPG
ncbi:MAG: tRNA 2-thiouridine(34) synthase MnmA [Myxococcales bacterium]|nr:tRNA 2-thiouridine(34) synthase MnmA [Myxococcales bacterium]